MTFFPKNTLPRLVSALLVLAATSSAFANEEVPTVQPIPDTLRASLKLDPFYQKHIDLHGLPILGSAKVTDFALREAAWLIGKMLSFRPEIYQCLVENDARVVVMAYNEYTTDVPEQADMKDKEFWDRRARGLGGRISSCGEEGLLAYPGDPYLTENLLIHEFAHTIHSHGLKTLFPDFDQRLKAAYEKAIAAGLWKGTYAAENHHEYWAEGVQSWFDNNRENDAIHNHVNTRAELKEYDPVLAKFCIEVFGDDPWRYAKPMERPAGQRLHLEGFDPAKSPTFQWRAKAKPKPRD